MGRPLWLAAEWALFSCSDRALWNFSRLFWVASKSNERVGENNKKDGQKVVQLYFQSLKEKLAYRNILVWATKRAMARASECEKLLPVFLFYSSQEKH